MVVLLPCFLTLNFGILCFYLYPLSLYSKYFCFFRNLEEASFFFTVAPLHHFCDIFRKSNKSLLCSQKTRYLLMIRTKNIWKLAMTRGFPCVKFGIKMGVIIHINLPLESLYLFKKKNHQNPLRSFKDLNIHKDRQRKTTLFYTTSTQ